MGTASSRAYAVQMHLHGSMSEGPASCLAHDHEAAETGSVDVIWWTDHDFRVSNFAKLQRCAFEALEDWAEIPNRSGDPREPLTRVPVTWTPVGGDSALAAAAGMAQGQARVSRERVPDGGGSRGESARGESALEVELPAHEGTGGGLPPARTALYELKAGAHYETFPLLTRPKVRLAVNPDSGIGPTGRVVVRFLLSEQPPDLRQSELTYVLGGQRQGEWVDGRSGTIARPALPGAWQELELDLAADVERLGLPGGLDNSLHRLQIGVASDGPAVRARFAGLEIEPQHRGPGVLDLHRCLLQALPTRVRHLVGLEVSYYGRHITAFGSSVPIPDYDALLPGALTNEEAVEHIHRHGGLACLCHPPRTDVEGTAALLAENRVYGADLLEVAHAGAGLADRLRLWDQLAQHGLVITGTGVSDAHSARVGWRPGDRPAGTGRPVSWVTRIWAASADELDLLAALRRGHAFFADPSQFRGTLDLTAPDGATMGDVLVLSGAPPRLTAHVEGLQPGDLVTWYRNGSLVHAAVVQEKEYSEGYAGEWQPHTTVVGLQAVRLQVHRPSLADSPFGGVIACGNPIYLVAEPPRTGHRVRRV